MSIFLNIGKYNYLDNKIYLILQPRVRNAIIHMTLTSIEPFDGLA